MKLRNKIVIFIVILSIGMFGYVKLNASTEPDAKQVVAAADLRVLEAKTTLKRGDVGFIKIQGKPNTTYTIDTTFVQNNQVVRVRQIRQTDITGEAVFNWVVSNGTSFGTRSAVISGGGETIQTTHTVVQ